MIVVDAYNKSIMGICKKKDFQKQMLLLKGELECTN